MARTKARRIKDKLKTLTTIFTNWDINAKYVTSKKGTPYIWMKIYCNRYNIVWFETTHVYRVFKNNEHYFNTDNRRHLIDRMYELRHDPADQDVFPVSLNKGKQVTWRWRNKVGKS